MYDAKHFFRLFLASYGIDFLKKKKKMFGLGQGLLEPGMASNSALQLHMTLKF